MPVKANFQSICIAVRDLDAATKRFQELFDAPLVKSEVHPEEQVKWVWFDLGGVFVELISPTSPDSQVAKFLDRHGEGLFLLGLRVGDIEEARKKFKAADLRVVYPEANESFPGGGKYNFVHPSSFFGTLIEFRQFNGVDDFAASLSRPSMVPIAGDLSVK
jgi:methylmalonyl-CoA/ethylmalonyl-CoA epimerase